MIKITTPIITVIFLFKYNTSISCHGNIWLTPNKKVPLMSPTRLNLKQASYKDILIIK